MNQDQVKDHFARQADEYEKLMVRIVPHYLEQHQIIFDLLPEVAKEYRVLDLGCGNGILTDLVFRKLPNSYLVGIDLTEKMLAAFEKNVSAHSGKFELIQGGFRKDSIGEKYDIIFFSGPYPASSHMDRKRNSIIDCTRL